MEFTCNSSCIGSTILLVDFQGGGCSRQLCHMCQRGYEILKGGERDRPEQSLCHVCVDKCRLNSEDKERRGEIRVDKIMEVKELGGRGAGQRTEGKMNGSEIHLFLSLLLLIGC